MKTNLQILILYGYNGKLAASYSSPGVLGEININTLRNDFENLGYFVETSRFSELDLSRDFSGWFVLYSSSEERGLFYKSYIEDILLKIKMNGAILLPDFKYFRSHHNKSFGEMLRLGFKSEKLKTISSKAYGNIIELKSDINNVSYPVVIKTSSGAGSSGVKLVHNKEELLLTAEEMSKIICFDHSFTELKNNSLIKTLKNTGKRLIGRKDYTYSHMYSNKIILQNFIENLTGDFKILVFADKYYVLNRENRNCDFRASGSGKFVFPTEVSEIEDVLDFAKLAYEELDIPICSIDVGRANNTCHLLEFQCLNFGPYTLQFSPCYFTRENDKWTKVLGSSNLENEYCRAIDIFINNINIED